jgi:hypothetical protein
VKTFPDGICACAGIDWEALPSQPIEVVRLAVDTGMRDLDGAEETIFHLRIRILRAARKVRLWEQYVDPDTGQPFTDPKRWIQVRWPRSWRYCKDAMDTEEPLKDLPIETITQITGANLKVLAHEGLSSNLRTMPAVLEAAKKKTKDGLIDYLNQNHQQHIGKVTVTERGASAKMDEAIMIAKVIYDCKTDGEAQEAIAAEFVDEHAVEYEMRRAS